MPTLRIHLHTTPLAYQQFLCLRLGDQLQSSFGDAPKDICLTMPLDPHQPCQRLFGAFVHDARTAAQSAGIVIHATFELLPDPAPPAEAV